MTEVFVLAEHVTGQVKKVSGELLTLAARLGDPVAVAVGAGAEAAAGQLAAFGATKVYVAADPVLDDYVAAPVVEVLACLVKAHNPAAVLIASTATGKEVAGRLAVRLDSGLITDAVGLAPDGTATQSVFGGATTVHSKVVRGTPIITVRSNSVSPDLGAAAGVVELVAVELPAESKTARVVQRVEAAKAARPDLAEAAVVISGGRGCGSAAGFQVVEELADVLGGAVGASRAATDAGWYPHEFQVGQTGKTVSPQLYLAAGISGAIQHRAGMQTAKNIVVVNKDPEAPLFELADFGVVGDLFQVLPQLTAAIKARKG